MKPIDSDILDVIENNMKRGGPGDKTKPGRI